MNVGTVTSEEIVHTSTKYEQEKKKLKRAGLFVLASAEFKKTAMAFSDLDENNTSSCQKGHSFDSETLHLPFIDVKCPPHEEDDSHSSFVFLNDSFKELSQTTKTLLQRRERLDEYIAKMKNETSYHHGYNRYISVSSEDTLFVVLPSSPCINYS